MTSENIVLFFFATVTASAIKSTVILHELRDSL